MLSSDVDMRKVNGKKGKCKSADFLRRRLAQAEMQLREMEAESKRVAAQQKRTMSIVMKENKDCLEKIECIRMEECVDNLNWSEGLSAAKILASKSHKYCRSRDLVASHRTACMEAEAELAATRQQILDLRRKLHRMKKRAAGTAHLVSRTMFLHNRSSESWREQLKNLESRIVQEKEKLGSMAMEAKTIRTEIDGCLIEQARFEKLYASRLNELLEKQKEISYVTEVCQVIFEERDHQVWELREVQRLAEQERQQYEKAFAEISGVLEENSRQCLENKKKNADIRKSIDDTRVERMGIEAELAKLRKSAQKQLQQSGDLTEMDETDDISSKIKEFTSIFDTLADIAGVESIADVVNFPKNLGEKRFSTFKEINHLDSSIQELEREKNELIEALTLLSQKSPDNDQRLLRMEKHRERLQESRERIIKEEKNLKKTNGALDAVCSDIETLFKGLDCSTELLNERTGMTAVLPSTAVVALGIVEQRAEEYLLALSQQKSKTTLEQVAEPLIRRPDLYPRKTISISKQLRKRELPRTTDSMVTSNNISFSCHFPPEDHPITIQEARSIVDQRTRTPLQVSRRVR